MNRNKRAGTSLIELLVVMVVFLIGILAILQIFPGGFKVLGTTRNNAIATALARAQIESVKSRSDTLAEMILMVQYTFVGGPGVVNIIADTSHGPDHLGYDGVGLDSNGNVLDGGGNSLGLWDYLTGANHSRRIIGEGGRVPAPRAVGADFGGLMVLQFSPIVFNPAYPTLLQVYGNDMVRRDGAPFGRVRPWEYFIEDAEDPGANIYLPRSTTLTRSYRLAMAAWINNGGTISRRDIVDTTIVVPSNPAGGYDVYPLSNFAALGGGETFVGAEFESIRVARLFERVAAFTPGEPYEYKLLDPNLGILLFNPAGYNWTEPRTGGRRIPLVSRVNYDVFDWRIIRDEFRVPSNMPFQNKLQLGNLKVDSTMRPDGRNYAGMDVPVADGAGGTEQRSFLIVDLATGGVLTKDSFLTDTSFGLVTFTDTDNVAAGLQMKMILPGQTLPVTVDASGRAVRALYEANGEWAVQVMKAPSLFRITYGAPGVAQYYVGNSAAAGGSPTRVYFPIIDAGKKVVLGEAWYRDGGGNLKSIQDQDFVIQSTPADPLGAYVDITSVDAGAVAFDSATYGYSVRRVKGASVSVRVLWNPATFFLTGDSGENDRRFNSWLGNFRKSTVETYLQRGEN